jgi:hypothetical protein
MSPETIREEDTNARARRVAEAQYRLAMATHVHARLRREAERPRPGMKVSAQPEVAKARGEMLLSQRDFNLLWGRLLEASPDAAEIFKAQSLRQAREAETLGRRLADMDANGYVLAAEACVALEVA